MTLQPDISAMQLDERPNKIMPPTSDIYIQKFWMDDTSTERSGNSATTGRLRLTTIV